MYCATPIGTITSEISRTIANSNFFGLKGS